MLYNYKIGLVYKWKILFFSDNFVAPLFAVHGGKNFLSRCGWEDGIGTHWRLFSAIPDNFII